MDSDVSGEELRGHLAAILLTAELIADAPSLPHGLRSMAETQHRRAQQLARALAEQADGRDCDCYRWAARLCSQEEVAEC